MAAKHRHKTPARPARRSGATGPGKLILIGLLIVGGAMAYRLSSAPAVQTPGSGVRASAMDADLPPLPTRGMPLARPIEVVEAAYEFAARHPEVMDYVPCYCGCETFGHRDNDDCFVASRDASGQVTWEPHGMT